MSRKPLELGKEMVPHAYRPVVSLDQHEITDIYKRTEEWLKGDYAGAVEYSARMCFVLYQTYAAIALKDVVGRNGLNARIQAGRGFFEMAEAVLEKVREIQGGLAENRRAKFVTVPKPKRRKRA